MRSYLKWAASLGALAGIALVSNCGGASNATLGTGGDASADGSEDGTTGGSSGSGSGSGSSTGGGSGSTSSGSGSGSSSGGHGSSSSGSGSSSGGHGSSSGSSSGSSGSGSSSGSSSGSGSGSGSSSGGTMDAGSDSGKVCPTCVVGEMCCADTCVNLSNNPDHCGDCSTKCNVAKDACVGGHCVVPTCSAATCTQQQLCCGAVCCDGNQICCQTAGPLMQLYCFTPTSTQSTCPAQ